MVMKHMVKSKAKNPWKSYFYKKTTKVNIYEFQVQPTFLKRHMSRKLPLYYKSCDSPFTNLNFSEQLQHPLLASSCILHFYWSFFFVIHIISADFSKYNWRRVTVNIILMKRTSKLNFWLPLIDESFFLIILKTEFCVIFHNFSQIFLVSGWYQHKTFQFIMTFLQRSLSK